MKKQLLIFAALLTLCSCKKFKEPTPLTIEQINAQYVIHYGHVTFQSSQSNLATQITKEPGDISSGRSTIREFTNCDSIESRFRYSAVPGIHSYTIFTTKIENNYLVPDKIYKTGTIDVAEYSCNVVKLD